MSLALRRTVWRWWRGAACALPGILGAGTFSLDAWAGDAPAAGPSHASTIVLDEARHRVWTVNPDHDSAAAIDTRRLVRLFEAKVGDRPRTLAVAKDGGVWVVNQGDATVSVLDSSGGLLRTLVLPYASRPFGIAFSPRGDFAYVTLEASGRLLRLDPASGAVAGMIDVGPTPRGIAITADGQRVLVTRYISPRDRGEVVEVDAGTFEVVRRFDLAFDPGPDSPVSGRGVPNHLISVTILPNGERAWIPSKKDNTARGLLRTGEILTFETTTRTIVSQIDLVHDREVLSARRDLDDRAMAVAVAFDAAGQHAFVAVQGSNAVEVLDVQTGGLVRSIPDTGLAPQGVVVDGAGRLFVQNFLTRDVAVYDVSSPESGTPRIASVPTAEREALAPQVLLGKQVFFNAADPRMSRDGYVSCAGCHLEGGSDGRVWDYSGRGAHGGGFRNTIALVGRGGLNHGPLHWRADLDEIQDFEILLRTTLEGRGFVSDAVYHAKGGNRVFGTPNAGLSRELDALAAYLSTLARVRPSPHRDPGGIMTAAALAGEGIFHSSATGCATCHAAPRFTDSSLRRTDNPGADTGLPFVMHDVGTLSAAAGDFSPNTLRALDTPTVKGVWETPPYLHDGSAATLMDVILDRNVDDRHGRTSHLTVAERTELVAYLEQLDDTVVETAATITSRPVVTGLSGEVDLDGGSVWGVRVDAGAHGGIRVESVTLEVAGVDALQVRIHADVDGDGHRGPRDKLLGETAVSPDGDPVTVPLGPAPIVGAGGSASLLVSLRRASEDGAVAGRASAGRAYRVLISDIGAVGLTSATPSARTGVPLVAWMGPGSEGNRHHGCEGGDPPG